MAFLLNVDNRPDGTTVFTYDTGPTSRTQLVTLTENAHLTYGVLPDDLLKGIVHIERPPTTSRRHP